MDLGAGCGVAGLGLLLRGGAGQVLGLDVDPDMTAAAQANAARLGFSHRIRSLTLDLRSVRDADSLAPESFDLALANPPFRTPGSGRRCPDQARDRARFEAAGTLDDFARQRPFS